MTNSIKEISAKRQSAAHDAYIPLMDTNGALCDKIRDYQWGLVEAKKADMDEAFVLAVEKLVINQ